MRWITPLLAALLIIGILPADDSAGGSPPPYVEVEFIDNESPHHIIMRVFLAPGDTIPAESVPELPEGMIAWALSGTYTPFDFSTPIYEWTALHPIDRIPTPPPAPEDVPAPHAEGPRIQTLPMVAFIAFLLGLAYVAYRIHRRFYPSF